MYDDISPGVLSVYRLAEQEHKRGAMNSCRYSILTAAILRGAVTVLSDAPGTDTDLPHIS